MTTINASRAPASGTEIISESGGAIKSEPRGGFLGIGTKGERREETHWVTVTILNEKAAQWAIANIAKGDAVYAECRIADGSYKKDGETVYTTDIIANVFHKLDLGSRDDAA